MPIWNSNKVRTVIEKQLSFAKWISGSSRIRQHHFQTPNSVTLDAIINFRERQTLQGQRLKMPQCINKQNVANILFDTEAILNNRQYINYTVIIKLDQLSVMATN